VHSGERKRPVQDWKVAPEVWRKVGILTHHLLPNAGS